MSAGKDPDFDAIFADAPAEGLNEPAAVDASLDAPAAEAEASAEAATETPAAPAEPQRPRGPKKPWWDIYTSMLALTLLAIVLGCVFLVMEWSRYNFETTPSVTPASGAPAANG